MMWLKKKQKTVALNGCQHRLIISGLCVFKSTNYPDGKKEIEKKVRELPTVTEQPPTVHPV